MAHARPATGWAPRWTSGGPPWTPACGSWGKSSSAPAWAPWTGATRRPQSSRVREEIESYVERLASVQPCPECGGTRLRKESLAIRVGGLNIAEVTRKSVKAAAEFFDGLGTQRVVRGSPAPYRQGTGDRPPHPERDPGAAGIPDQRRAGLPDAGSDRRHAGGRGGAAHPSGDPDRQLADGRPLHPGRAQHRPAPAGQRPAAQHAEAAARPRQHRPGGGARRGDDPRPRTM